MGRVGEGIAEEKDDVQIVEERAVLHLFCSLFVLRHEKPFDVCRLVQRVHVLVGYRELCHL